MEKIKIIAKVTLVLVGIVAFGGWYYLEGKDTLDPTVYFEAESTLKKLDETREEAGDCHALLKLESQELKILDELKSDPNISVSQKAINKEREATLVAKNKEHKLECEPKVAVYTNNYDKYLYLYQQIKLAEKPRFTKLFNKNQEEIKAGFPFELKYSLKYAITSKRFEW